jgi:hypothetical protein
MARMLLFDSKYKNGALSESAVNFHWRQTMELIDRHLAISARPSILQGFKFRPKLLAQGVFALLTSPVLRDHSDFIVGHRGILLVDSGVNGPMARQIQASVRTTTEKANDVSD